MWETLSKISYFMKVNSIDNLVEEICDHRQKCKRILEAKKDTNILIFQTLWFDFTFNMLASDIPENGLFHL